MISDARARRIATDWHGGHGAPLHVFATTGATVSDRYTLDDVRIAVEYLLLPHIVTDSERHWPTAGTDLRELHAYIRRVGKRGAVTGWAEIEDIPAGTLT